MLFSAVWWSAGTTSSEECRLAFLGTWFQFILKRVQGNGSIGILRKSPRESQVGLTCPFDNGSCERDELVSSGTVGGNFRQSMIEGNAG
jgi:hypothetical protein